MRRSVFDQKYQDSKRANEKKKIEILSGNNIHVKKAEILSSNCNNQTQMNSSASILNETRNMNEPIALKNSMHFSQVSQHLNNMMPNNNFINKNISDEFTLQKDLILINENYDNEKSAKIIEIVDKENCSSQAQSKSVVDKKKQSKSVLPDISLSNHIKKIEKKEKKNNAQSYAKMQAHKLDLEDHN